MVSLVYKFIITGGGTGGHLFPALAIAEGLKKNFTECEILFIGSRKGIENKVVPEKGFRLLTLPVLGWRRNKILTWFSFGFNLMIALYKSYHIIKDFKPDLVIGTGGYASFPAVFVAAKMKLPTLVQEQNSYPGLVTRITSRFAKRVILAYRESLKYFKNPEKIKILGNPIRNQIGKAKEMESKQKFQLSQEKKVVFILGGSQGSGSLNQAVLQDLEILKQNNSLQLLWQTGEKDFSDIEQKVKESRISARVFPFITDMAEAYAASDLVVSRSGALTLAEITVCGKPALLVPYPFATANHQFFNAQVLKEKGCAELILEKELVPGKLGNTINQILSDKNRLKQMEKQSQLSAQPEALEKILEEINLLLVRN